MQVTAPAGLETGGPRLETRGRRLETGGHKLETRGRRLETKEVAGWKQKRPNPRRK